MRSTFFDRPIEYQLLCSQEEWLQGDPVNGVLTMRNLHKEVADITVAQVLLAYGNFRRVKANEPDCWEVLRREKLTENMQLEGHQSAELEWKFRLPTDAPITDKSGSLFLLFGGADTLTRGGRLDVRTNLIEVLQSFLQTFVTQFHFLQKYTKHKDGWTEVKLEPPTASREFPNLEHVLCYLRLLDDRLELRYKCKIKTLKRDGETMKVRGKNLEISQNLTRDEYLQGSGFPNRNKFREVIDEALNAARPSVIF
jgi:hypothetical protein